MIIKKFQGSTETEAITKARDELGNNAIVMNVKTIKPRGLMRLFKPVTVEITAALEENADREATKADTDTARTSQQVKETPIADKSLEEKLETLQAILQQQQLANMDNNSKQKTPQQTAGTAQNAGTIKEDMEVKTVEKVKKDKNNNLAFIKMLYNTLLENEVDEHYVNKIMDEMDNIMRSDLQIDSILSNLYQKLILKFGKSEEITLQEDKPKVVFLIGPTGVGKTTTIAKLASHFKIAKKKKVAFLTADTYRIAAAEQLKTYADIIDAPLTVCYSAEDVANTLEVYRDYELILVDTAGYSHKNMDQQLEIKRLIDSVSEEFEKEVYLVLSATTKYADLKSIVDAYRSVSDVKIIFTKLDETTAYGNLLNVRMYSGASLSYTTNGQNVPDDLEIFNSQRIVKLLLGGKA